MKLSAHFSLSEFTRSDKARELGINNQPGILQINHLSKLCEHVLEPLRAHFGKPVMINSGYRSPALNKAVGGSATSQHVNGEAADIHIPSVSMAEIWGYIRDNLDFYELIAEKISRRDGSAGWIHVSYRAGEYPKMAKSFIGKGQYPRGLHYID